MTTIITRAGKGSPLTNNEMDSNLTNLNTDKIETAMIVAATSKATPVDADLLALVDSAASNTLKKLTWANLKAAITGSFATLTGIETLTNKTLTSPVINGTGLNFSDSSVQNTAATGFGFKNRIINGAMMIDQRNAGASVTPTTSGTYLVDRFNSINNQPSKLTYQQSTTVPAGFKNSLSITTASAYTPATGETFGLRQHIEGYNVSDLGWGTAGAATVTLSFWVRSSLTGTFGGALLNNAGNRFYVFSYTINSANTWEQKSITIVGDTTGTWATDNSVGITVTWSLGTGATLSGTAGSWGATTYYSVTGGVQPVANAGATFYITGVQLEKGSTATSFDYRPYGTELALCQRYFQKTYSLGTKPGATGGYGAGIYNGALFSYNQPALGSGSVGFNWQYKVFMRTAPTITAYSPATGSAGYATASTTDFAVSINSGITGEYGCQFTGATLAANDCYVHATASAEL